MSACRNPLAVTCCLMQDIRPNPVSPHVSPHVSPPGSLPQRARHTAWRTAIPRILWCEPLWIALLAPALLFPGRFWVAGLQPLLVLLLFAFWPLRFLAATVGGLRTFRASPLDLALAALLAAVGAVLATSPAPASSWEAAGCLLLGVAAAAALIQWPPAQRRPALAAWILLAMGAAVAAVGPLLLGSHADKLGLGFLAPGAGSWTGTLAETLNPNVLGGALLEPLLLALALAVGPRWSRQPWRWVGSLLCLGLAAELVLTECRGAWLGAAAGVTVILLLRWPTSGRRLLPWGGLAAVVLLPGWLAAGGSTLLFDAFTSAAVATRGGDGLADRITIWQAAAAAIARQPLNGLGLGLFGPWVTQHGLLPAAHPPLHAHNLLLQVAADLGGAGLAAYSAVLLVTGWMLATCVRRRPQHWRRHEEGASRPASPRPGAPAPAAQRPPVRPQPPPLAAAAVHRLRLHWTLAVGCSGALAGLLVHGLVDAALWGNKAATLPWLLIALACLLFGAQQPAPAPHPLHPSCPAPGEEPPLP